jgi:hypothetical protein
LLWANPRAKNIGNLSREGFKRAQAFELFLEGHPNKKGTLSLAGPAKTFKRA